MGWTNTFVSKNCITDWGQMRGLWKMILFMSTFTRKCLVWRWQPFTKRTGTCDDNDRLNVLSSPLFQNYHHSRILEIYCAGSLHACTFQIPNRAVDIQKPSEGGKGHYIRAHNGTVEFIHIYRTPNATPYFIHTNDISTELIYNSLSSLLAAIILKTTSL